MVFVIMLGGWGLECNNTSIYGIVSCSDWTREPAIDEVDFRVFIIFHFTAIIFWTSSERKNYEQPENYYSSGSNQL